METVDKTKDMTQDEKYLYNVLSTNLNQVIEKCRVEKETIREGLKTFFLSILGTEVPTDIKFHLNTSDYCTDIKFHTDGDKWGSNFTIYNKINHFYRDNKEDEYDGFEVSSSSLRFNSEKLGMDSVFSLKLVIAICEHTDRVKAELEKAWNQHLKLNKEYDTAAKPVKDLVRKVSNRVKENKIKEITESIGDNVVFESGDGKDHVVIVKVNKKTAEVREYRNGYLKDNSMRKNISDLIRRIGDSNMIKIDKQKFLDFRKEKGFA